METTAQLAQPLSVPAAAGEEKRYLDDLGPELARVLRVQLHQAGAVSAVIEMPGSFLVFLAQERSAETLRAAALSLPKRSYEDWLATQPES